MKKKTVRAWGARVLPVISLTAVALGWGGCRLISVATLVGKGFAPALGKGDKKKLKHHSSRRLALYWEAFTEREIRAAVGADRPRKGKGKGAAKSRRKSPSIKFVSFRSKGNRAVLKVKRGKGRFAFTCLYQNGRWRVHDVDLTLKGKPRRLSRMLQLLVAAKTLQRGLEVGSRYVLHNISTPRFRREVLARLTDAELRVFADSGVGGGSKGKSRRKRGRGPKISSEVHAKGATVSVTRSPMPARIHLVTRDGQYWVDHVELKLGGQWHALGGLLSYLGPTLALVRWADRNVIRPATFGRPSDRELTQLVTHLRGLFSEAIWRPSFGWMKPRDLGLLPWRAIQTAVAPGVRPKPHPRPRPAGPSLGLKAIQRFERKGNRLEVVVAVGERRFGMTMVQERGHWRLGGGWVVRKRNGKRIDAAALLQAFGPLAQLGATAARLAPEVALGGDRSRRALRQLFADLRKASSQDFNRRFWARIPPRLVDNLPVNLLPQALQSLLPRPGGLRADTAPVPKRPRPSQAPAIDVGDIHQSATHLRLHLRVSGRPLVLSMVKEQGRWKLDDVHATVAGELRSMKRVATLMVPAVALGHAVLAGDGQSLRDSMAAPLRRRVVNPLLRILGPRFKVLMKTIRTAALPKPAAAKATPTARNTAPPTDVPKRSGFKLLSFTHDVKAGRAGLKVAVGPKAVVAISLTRDAKEIWRIADVQFPLMGRQVALSRVGPVLSPVMGFGLSLLAADLRGVRRSCSHSFNRAAWFKLNRKRFKKLIKQFTSPKKGGKTAGRKSTGPKGPTAKPKGPPRPKLVAFRIKDKVRWPWAQVALKIGGRRILIALVRAGQTWQVHDVKLEIGGLTLSVKKLIALGL